LATENLYANTSDRFGDDPLGQIECTKRSIELAL